MTRSSLVRRPLVRWDGLVFRVDLDMVEVLFARELRTHDAPVRRLQLGGMGEVVRVDLELTLKGFPARIAAELEEIRIYRGFLGCRVRSLRGPMNLPIPLSLAAWGLARAGHPDIRLDTEDGVLLVDIRRRLPSILDLHLSSVQVVARELRLSLGPGRLFPPPTELSTADE